MQLARLTALTTLPYSPRGSWPAATRGASPLGYDPLR
jgi:hypothetical protein